ncbi:Crp/Fnr family transcriptional regulator [Chroococcus sp. FPU101]|uniref:Crp/Fnr family transcriptional regulator n=1 Tax=Chroococcus sp. FPU101 TaxID=1974212 RepID=UPI001A8DE6C8|nr:Crp/Fnr family transcriptional regulator [Chroococcus sp. FPU101]GFE70450.1 cyclic nucleotide-binding protein [Chroococcus sp. FPU101]
MASKNLILDSLPTSEYEWLQPKLTEVELQQSDILYQAREQIRSVYFPTTCLLSLTNSTEMGEIVEIGVTSNEGLSGVTLLLGEDISPWRTEVQMSGRALKLKSEDFTTALDQFKTLRQRVAAFSYLKMVQLSQSALCDRFHSVEERLCRWLLVAQDHSKRSEFSLTREILAEMIGAGRPTVSLVTGTLQSAGLIRADRGKITILNREGMEDAACECYFVVKEALEQYLTQKIKL